MRRPPVVGLSPPTRGNLFGVTRRQERDRSIPAHAGEPRHCEPPPPLLSVYPRPRGGTAFNGDLAKDALGLSPPTRGNLRDGGAADVKGGSIPAHAGEPRLLRICLSRDGVYPRPRGGTYRAASQAWSNCGLSPPTRGNRQRAPRPEVRRRSIPAHAGEPADPALRLPLA